MNIFYLAHEPDEAARYHCNKHVVKMILESAQLLSTAHHFGGTWEEPMYKPTHQNHPCAKWVRASASHYYWLYDLMIHLGEEFRQWRGKEHLTIQKLDVPLAHLPGNMKSAMFTEPPQCMPDEYLQTDTVEAYREYYLHDKRSIATWTDRTQPWWWE